MSADNGYILRKNWENKFVLQMYFASADSYPEMAEARPSQIFDTVQEAVEAYEEIVESSDYPIEYGLTVNIKKVSE